MSSRTRRAAIAAAVLSSWPGLGRSEEGDPCAQVARSQVVACAQKGSLALAAQGQAVRAARARLEAVRPLLPSNPVLTGTVGTRPATRLEPGAAAWSLSLSQEIEIAGQRSLRRAERDADIGAAEARTAAVAREVAAEAMAAYFDALAADEVARLATRLESLAAASARAAQARAERGLGSRVEAEVAEAGAIRARKARLAAEHGRRLALVVLATRLGRDPTSHPVRAAGPLEPLTVPGGPAGQLARAAADAHPEAAALLAQARAQEARAAVLSRERIPNPTLSAFAQTDGADGRIFGLGVSLPMPLPHPVGRTNAGEMAEAQALARRARDEAAQRGRLVLLEVLGAVSAFERHRAEVEALSQGRLARTERALADIAAEIEAGRLAIRDALVLQQGLVELLSSHLESRRALCLASVELRRAAGLPLDGGSP